MSGFSLLLLHQNFEPEDPIGCDFCGGFYDLRYWGIEDGGMECPNCGEESVVDEVVAEQA